MDIYKDVMTEIFSNIVKLLIQLAENLNLKGIVSPSEMILLKNDIREEIERLDKKFEEIERAHWELLKK